MKSSPLNHHLHGGPCTLDDLADLVVSHLDLLLAVDVPDIIPLLQPSLLCSAVGLDPPQLDGEGLVLAPHDHEAPGLALLAGHGHIFHLLGHRGWVDCQV